MKKPAHPGDLIGNKLVEALHRSPLRLTDEQAAEVRRRLANSSSKRIPAQSLQAFAPIRQMRVTFDPAASYDLDRAFEWIAKDSPARRVAVDRPAPFVFLQCPPLTA